MVCGMNHVPGEWPASIVDQDGVRVRIRVICGARGRATSGRYTHEKKKVTNYSEFDLSRK